MTYLLEQFRTLVEYLILTLGYPGLALIMVLENVFPPIPSEMVLPFAGSLVHEGQLNLFAVLLSSTLGATLGTGFFYYLGYRLGEARTRILIGRYGRWLLLDEAELDRSLRLFRRHDRSIIFFARFLPGVRTLISLPAGIARMRVSSFLLFTVLGTLAWNALLIGAGVILGRQWERILDVVDRFETLFWLLIVALLAYFVVTRVRALRQART